MAIYATVDELRDHINKTDSVDDATLQRLLNAASRYIDRKTNRPDGFVADSTATARVYVGSGKEYQFIDECIAITKVAVKTGVSEDDYTEWDSTDWQAFTGDPRRPIFNQLPYTGLLVTAGGNYGQFTSGMGIYPTVQVTAKWGYSEECPDIIRTATIMVATRWWGRLQSGMSDGVGNVEFGFVLMRQPIDPDIEGLLRMGRLIRPVI